MDRPVKKCSMFLGSWICLFKCSSKVRKYTGKYVWTCITRALSSENNISAEKHSGTRLCNWLEHLWGNKIILKLYNQDMKNTSHSQMRTNWIRFLKIRHWNVPQFSKCSSGSRIPRSPFFPCLTMNTLLHPTAACEVLNDIMHAVYYKYTL